uniref:DDE-1 domain-containing protein n=1 Tax=Hyaloperonospora arabidopsidis (strain Emoy2) TaxID=559515 RepID=M4C4U5_HYAAE
MKPADAGIIANFKLKYKTRYIKYLLEKFEATGDHPFEPKNNFTIRQEIDMLVESWNNVQPASIRHCWEKTGNLPARDRMVVNSLLNTEGVDSVIQISVLLAKISQHNVAATMDTQSYLQVDGTLPIIENLTNEEILAGFSPDQKWRTRMMRGVMKRNLQCRCPGEDARSYGHFAGGHA